MTISGCVETDSRTRLIKLKEACRGANWNYELIHPEDMEFLAKECGGVIGNERRNIVAPSGYKTTLTLRSEGEHFTFWIITTNPVDW